MSFYRKINTLGLTESRSNVNLTVTNNDFMFKIFLCRRDHNLVQDDVYVNELVSTDICTGHRSPTVCRFSFHFLMCDVESSEEKKNGQDDDTVFPFLCLPKGGHAQINNIANASQQNLLLMGGRKYTYKTTSTERETSSYPKGEAGQGFGMKTNSLLPLRRGPK